MSKSVKESVESIRAIRRRIAKCRRAGRLGGKATASRLTEEQRRERSTNAGNSTLKRYGKGFYSHISKLGIKAISKNRKNTKRYKKYESKQRGKGQDKG